MKNETKNGLIIPKMESIEDIKKEMKISEDKVDIKEAKKDMEKAKETLNDSTTQKPKTTTESFMNSLNKTIYDMKNLQKDFIALDAEDRVIKFHGFHPIGLLKKVIYEDASLKSIKNSLSLKSIPIEMAFDILINYLEKLEQKALKRVRNKTVFINNQTFAESKGVIINENELLNLIDKSIETINTDINEILKFKMFEKALKDNFLDRMNVNKDLINFRDSFIDGLVELREIGFELIQKGKSFSELTNRLKEVNEEIIKSLSLTLS